MLASEGYKSRILPVKFGVVHGPSGRGIAYDCIRLRGIFVSLRPSANFSWDQSRRKNKVLTLTEFCVGIGAERNQLVQWSSEKPWRLYEEKEVHPKDS